MRGDESELGELQKEKLRLEIGEMKRSWWSPHNLLSAGTAIASLVVVALTLTNRDVEVQRVKNELFQVNRTKEQAEDALKDAKLLAARETEAAAAANEGLRRESEQLTALLKAKQSRYEALEAAIKGAEQKLAAADTPQEQREAAEGVAAISRQSSKSPDERRRAYLDAKKALDDLEAMFNANPMSVGKSKLDAAKRRATDAAVDAPLDSILESIKKDNELNEMHEKAMASIRKIKA